MTILITNKTVRLSHVRTGIWKDPKAHEERRTKLVSSAFTSL